MSDQDTIYALSSGSLPSGVAVVRISGDRVRFGLETLSIIPPEPRVAALKTIRKQNGSIIDKGLVIYFPGPHSFSGEDCAEIHLHGGRAVVEACLQALSDIEGFRLAQAGEFTKRAFDHGKMDLTEAEGLADLISSETEIQRKLAIRQSDGVLRELYDEWSTRILRSRALIEAELDFSDEEDIPGSVSDQVWQEMADVSREISKHLEKSHMGEISRSGFSIVIAGAPNSGKSSLINKLAGRDVAIVSDEEGTTRDILEVRLNIDGYLVIVKDTAGLRDTDSKVEREGIKRARDALKDADLVLYMVEPGGKLDDEYGASSELAQNMVVIGSKSDTADPSWPVQIDLKVNTIELDGVESLLSRISKELAGMNIPDDLVVPTRKRHIELLKKAVSELDRGNQDGSLPIEIRSEYLRIAQESLGQITGRVDVEDLLGVIFGEFCVGK